MRRSLSLNSILGVGLSLTVALTAVSAAPSVGSASAETVRSDASADPSADAGPLSRPDRVSAMSTAQAQDKPVEDESQRTATTATYANPDGSWTTEAYAGVVRAPGDDDSWVPVDASVKRDGDVFKPAATPVDVAFSDGGDHTVGALDAASGASVDVGWPTPLPAPTVAGDTLTYPNAAPDGGDLKVTSQPDGFDFSVVLDTPPAADAAPVEYRVPVKVGGATPVFGADGSILLKDGRDRLVTVTAPVMWDGQPGNAGGRGVKVPIAASFEGTGSDRTLVLKPDMGFLRDPSTVYPVTVDPSVVVNTAGDTWVQSTGDTSSQVNSPELRVGSADGGATVARSLIYFDFSGVSAPANAVFSKAQLKLSNFQAGSCTGSAVSVSRITGGWTLPSVAWATQPTVTTTNAASASSAFGATGCSAEGTMAFDLTAMYRDWVAGAWNVGVQVKADDEVTASGLRKFRSLENGDTSKVPQLVLTYNTTPDVPAAPVGVKPGATSGSTVYSNSSTPTFTTTVSDPDSSTVTGQFQLLQGSTVVDDWTSASVPSGSQVSRTLPTAVADGSYTARWRVSDGSSTSAWSAGQGVVIDTAKPAAPSIACSGNAAYANNTWTATGAGTASCTVSVTGDAVAVTARKNGADVAFPALSSGSTSKSFPVAANDYFKLEATAVDAAGNTSTTTLYRFAVGGGILDQPMAGVTSTGAFTVSGIGRGGASSAQLQWRPAGTTTWTSATKVTQASAAWSGSTTTDGAFGSTGQLTWSASTEPGISAPSNLEVQVCFTYATAPTSLCTASSTVSLVQHAFGGSFPVATAGPASVALMTGEFSVDATDVNVPGYNDSLQISRSARSFEGAVSSWQKVFGPGWVANFDGPSVGFSAAQVIDQTATNGTIMLVDTDGSTSVYKSAGTPGAQASGVYVGQGLAASDNERLEITGTTQKTLTLTEEDGTETSWAYSGGVWTVQRVLDSTQAPATRFVYTNGYLTSILSQAPGVTDANCSAATQLPGCRALVLSYIGTGDATRLTQVDLKTFDPKPRTTDSGTAGQEAGTPNTTAGMVSVTVAKYAYSNDAAATLVRAWDPRLDYNTGADQVATSYSYRSVLGKTMLATLTPPGEKTWNFNADSSGRLDTVTRAQDPAIGGTATWKIVYNVPLSGTGLPTMTSTDVAKWGQTVQVPSQAAALFGPEAPAPYSDYTYADLIYFNAAGQTVNTATYGAGQWLIDTTQYDPGNGLVSWTLDATNRSLGLFDYQASPAAIQAYLTTINTYSPTGDRIEQTLKPSANLVRKDGATVYGRERVRYDYDDEVASNAALVPGRPVVDAVLRRNLVVQTIKDVYETATGNAYDPETTINYYNAVVTGDGDGWVLQKPTRVAVKMAGGSFSTTVNRFDTQGRTILTRTAQGVGTSTYTANDTRSTYTVYYSAGATGPAACQNKPQWAGEVCITGPGDGSSAVAATTVPTTTATGYDYLGDPTRAVTTNTAGPVARASVATYDVAGRKTKESTATANAPAGEVATPATSYIYDPATGRPISTSKGTTTSTTTYDSWGRQLSVTDGAGNSGTTTYDAAGKVKTVNDGKGTYTYTYDGTDAAGKTERRGLVTSLKVGLASGPDVFTAAYDTGGRQTELVYPNGVVASSLYDGLGNQLLLNYANGGTAFLGFSAYSDVAGRVKIQQSAQSYNLFNYDERGRLTQVQDAVYGQCTTRQYTFTLDSDRTGMKSNAPAADGSCSTTTTATTVTGTFDADDRKTDAGYVYDTTGRTTTLPATDTVAPSAGAVTVGYYDNDMVASLNQGTGASARSKSFGLDVLGRLASISDTTGGIELRRVTNQYADTEDSPAWTTEQTRPDAATAWATSWKRNVLTPSGDLGMIQASDGTVKVQLTNIHGDVVSTIPNTTYSGLRNYSESTEYGTPRNTSTSLGQAYSWLGGKRRSGDALAGLVLMGVRLYNPVTGRFLTRDPVPGGNDNSYTYPADPVNQVDLDGKFFTVNHKFCNRNGCLSLSRYCNETHFHCSIAWGVSFKGELRRAYIVKLNWRIRIEGNDIEGGAGSYGHPEEGGYFFHGKWGVPSPANGHTRGKFQWKHLGGLWSTTTYFNAQMKVRLTIWGTANIGGTWVVFGADKEWSAYE